jgi:chorismate mutase
MTENPRRFDPSASSLAGEVDPAVMEELLSVRGSIDNIDATLVYLLAERFKATQRVGHLKAEHKLPPADPDREAAQIARLRALGVRGKIPELHHFRGHPPSPGHLTESRRA